ncbi:hypothetical protein AVEN_124931-1, partial [Araneus ventricosus]
VFNEESPYPEEPGIISNSYQYKSATSLSPTHERSQSLVQRSVSNSSMPYQSMTLDRAKFSQMKNRHESKPPPPPPPIKSSKTRYIFLCLKTVLIDKKLFLNTFSAARRYIVVRSTCEKCQRLYVVVRSTCEKCQR